MSTPERIKWTSVTSFVGLFKPKFDAKAQAKKSSKNKRSKWYGMTEKEILAVWNGESNRATGLGNWYHGQREKDILKKTIEDFIALGSPVSSQRLHKQYFNQLSSATIRNSLANLEKIGLLKSIHRSS